MQYFWHHSQYSVELERVEKTPVTCLPKMEIKLQIYAAQWIQDNILLSKNIQNIYILNVYFNWQPSKPSNIMKI